MNKALKKAVEHWQYIAPIVSYPRNEKEFDLLRSRLYELLDIVGNDENHPLMDLVDIMSDTVEKYEANHYPPPKSLGVNALKYLMEQQGLRQSDLSDIASQGVMSEILNGKRKLNLSQIKKLAKRFNLSPETFMDD